MYGTANALPYPQDGRHDSSTTEICRKSGPSGGSLSKVLQIAARQVVVGFFRTERRPP